MPAESSALPFVDEHAVTVHAPPAAVWAELASVMRIAPEPLGRGFTRLLGAHSRRTTGVPLTEGSTMPGFTVTEAVPGSRLVLSGRHRFADYALVFTLTEQDGATRLAAASLSRFPGLPGRVYRALVIGSRGHRILVVRMLHGVRRRAEARAAVRGRAR